MSQKVHHLPRMGITAAMRVYGATARALRFYEELGLIEAQRDRLNTRFYDATARARLEWISSLRRADISLPDIQEVLNIDDPAARAACAARKLKARAEALREKLDAIDAALNTLCPNEGAPLGAEAGSPRALRG